MHNSAISAKKTFTILTKLMKNTKTSSIPPLLDNNNVINDPFPDKATAIGNDDPVPILQKNENILSPLNMINTSPIEVAKIIREIKKSNSSNSGVSGNFNSCLLSTLPYF